MPRKPRCAEIIREILNARTPAPFQANETGSRVHAAVLMPLFLDDGQCRVVFTKRTAKVSSHKGQISFPGGVVDDDDDGFLETALREAEEEIGLHREDVALLGRTDDIQTKATDFIVHPFVGLIPSGYGFRINPGEVEKILSVPLWVFFSNDPRYKKAEAEFQGVIYPGTAWRYHDDLIWGATARIILNFVHIIGERLTPLELLEEF